MFDIITVGGATIDSFLDTNVHNHFIGKMNEICYPLGAKLRINNVDIFTGGGGCNTAVAFARIGLKTGFLGNLGNDYNGKLVLDELKKEKVKFLGTISKDKTDFSMILDSKGRDRTVLTYKDASGKLNYNKIRKNYNTKWYYFSSVFGDSLDTMKKLAKHAKNKVNIGFNASTYLAEQGVSKIKEILNATTILVLNKEEAELLIGKGSIENMLVKIRKTGPRIVCITDGKHGSYTFDGKMMYSQKPHSNIKVVEKTGAGDAYAATLVAGLIKRKSIEESMQLALTNAESVIRHKGAKNILLSWNKLNEQTRKHGSLIKKRLL